MMSERFSLLYRFYDDATNSWVDLTPQVDSRQTSITQNLCTNNFTSAKDEAVFVMPETNLFEYDGVTPTPKKKLIDKLLGGGDILVQINAPGPVDVLWNSEDVLWDGEHVQWGGSVRYFTGYIDRSSIELRSFPLPPRLEIRLQDVSVLRLDNKVEYHILLQNKKISEIVGILLTYAGYSYGSLSLDVSDDETIEAFAIDKDDADSYRSYIDTLLFEAGGYVLDFDENGIANVVKLQWDGSGAAVRTIDNPMNADGVSMKSAYLKEDGVKVKWSSLAWTEDNFPVWISNIQQEVEDGTWKGEEIEQLHYWPKDGDVSPSFMEYMADLLDRPYMTRASRVQNQDIEIIMAKDFSTVITAYRGGRPFHDTNFERPIPTSPVDFTDPDTYNLSSNPTYYAKKAWHLLRVPQWSVVPDVRDGIDNPLLEGWYTKSGDVYTKSTDIAAIPGRTYYMGADYDAVTPDPDDIPYVMGWYEKNAGVYSLTTDDHVVTGKTYYEATGGEVQLVFFSIKGKVLYRNKVNTVNMEGSKQPKEYESTYIYNQAHAERFAQFWWHFLQTSRCTFSWSEPNRRNALNDVVAVGVKGNGSTQKALIAGKTSKWINDRVEIISYTAVGIDSYTPADLVPISVVPSSTKPQVQPITGAKTATFATTPSYTLAQWQEFVGVLSTWEITNPSEFSVGDVAVINGTISDMDGLPISLYLTVTAVDDDSTLTGTGVKIEYVPVTQIWDFDLNTLIYSINKRDVQNFTHIVAKSKVKGYPSASLEWEARDASGTTITTGSGSAFDFYIPLNASYVSPISVILSEANGMVAPLVKTLEAMDETEYDHDFAVWEPTDDGTYIYLLPDHFTVNGVDYDVIKGDYFVSKVTFAPYSSGTAVVSPTGDPSAQGWYERKGSGTSAKPYYWLKTSDASVATGKTYGTVGSGLTKYEAGFAYIYTGSAWNGFDITDEANARKAANLLNDLVTGNVQIPESSSNFSMWTWAKNFAAQYAIINNLFSQAITILSGGNIKSENYAEGREGAVCEITDSEFGDRGITASVNESTFISMVGSGSYGVYKFVCIASSAYGGNWQLYKDNVAQRTVSYSSMAEDYGVSASYDFPEISSFVDDLIEVTYKYQTIPGKGFYLGADGIFVCNNATANALTIKGGSTFQGSFDCAAIKTSISNPTVSNSATASTINSNQAQNLRSAILALGTYTDNTKYPCRIQNVSSSIAYLSLKYSVEGGGFGVTIYTWAVTFYDSSFNPVDITSILSCTRTTTPSSAREYSYGIYRRSGGGADNYCYANSSFTVEFIVGGNTLTLDIPSSGSGLTSGQLFFGPVTTVGGVQCCPIYMKS